MHGLRDRKKRQRRERIFDAAIDAFNSKGFFATTMQEIAQGADLAVGTLYNYFPSKNDLLLGILEKKMEEIRRIDPRELVRLFREEEEGNVILERIVLSIVRKAFILTKRNWYEGFSALFASRPDVQRGITMDLEAIEMLERVLRHMQGRRLVRADVPARAMAKNLYSVIAFQFMSYVFMPEVGEEELAGGLSEQIRLSFLGLGMHDG
jgi:AcrR family transcriptional regulator